MRKKTLGEQDSRALNRFKQVMKILHAGLVAAEPSTIVQQVSQLLKQYRQMRSIMKALG